MRSLTVSSRTCGNLPTVARTQAIPVLEWNPQSPDDSIRTDTALCTSLALLVNIRPVLTDFQPLAQCELHMGLHEGTPVPTCSYRVITNDEQAYPGLVLVHEITSSSQKMFADFYAMHWRMEDLGGRLYR